MKKIAIFYRNEKLFYLFHCFTAISIVIISVLKKNEFPRREPQKHVTRRQLGFLSRFEITGLTSKLPNVSVGIFHYVVQLIGSTDSDKPSCQE